MFRNRYVEHERAPQLPSKSIAWHNSHAAGSHGGAGHDNGASNGNGHGNGGAGNGSGNGSGGADGSEGAAGAPAGAWRLEDSIWAGRQYRGGEDRGFYDDDDVVRRAVCCDFSKAIGKGLLEGFLLKHDRAKLDPTKHAPAVIMSCETARGGSSH